MTWYKDFCTSSAKMIEVVDSIDKTAHYFDIISNTRLPTNRQKMIKAITTKSYDLIREKLKKWD